MGFASALFVALTTSSISQAPVGDAPPAVGASPTPIAAPSGPGAARPTLVVLDDRATKDQAPAAVLARTVEELLRRRGLAVLRMSEGRRRLDARADKALSACGDDAGCLATAARDMGGNVVVMVRLTKREGAFFLALTRINALRPQVSDDEATIAGTEADAVAWVPEAVGELFAEAELQEGPGPRP